MHFITGRISVILFLSAFFTLPELNAQLLNVERIRIDPDTTGWKGDIGIDLSFNQLNDRVIRLSNTLNIAYQTDRHIHTALSSFDLVNVDGRALVSGGYLHFRSKLMNRKTVSPELFLQFQYNENLGLNNRSLAGSGLRYAFLNRSRLSGGLFTGLMFEHEQWGLRGEQEVVRNLLKSTNSINLTYEISADTRLFLIGYYQFRPDKPLAPRAILDSEFNIRISEILSLSLTFNISYDTAPVIEIRELTYELKNALVITL